MKPWNNNSPQNALRNALASPASAPHPEPDLLTAFAENSLSPREREPIAAHLAACETCRTVLALACEAAPDESLRPAASTARPRRLRIALPALAAAAAAAITIAVLHRAPAPQPPPAAVAVQSPQPAPQQPAPAQLTPPQPAARLGSAASFIAARPKAAPAHPQSKSAAGPEPAPVSTPTTTIAVQSAGLSPARNQAEPAAPTAPLAVSEPQLAQNDVAQPSLASGNLAQPSLAKKRVAQARSFDATRLPPLQQNYAEQAAPSAYDSAPTISALSQVASTSLPRPRWRINRQQQPERAYANGPWQQVLPADAPPMRALATSGRDVWAGGDNQQLYHSADSGDTWTRVPLPQKPSGPHRIAHIQIDAPGTLTIRATDGTTWTTTNNGATWN